MFLFSWLRHLQTRIPSPKNRRPRKSNRPSGRSFVRPRLEPLEDRLTPTDFGLAFGLGSTVNDDGNAIAADAAGNIYVTGSFRGTVDFAPGPEVIELTSASSGNTDAFVAKYSAAGTLIWAARFGDTNIDIGRAIAVDAAGNVYTTGSFVGTVDFDPGPGERTLSTINTSSNAYISKLDSGGNFVWARQVSANGEDIGWGIAVDATGNVYTTGSFQGTAVFQPGPGVANLVSANIDPFVCKLDGGGTFLWARGFRGTGSLDRGFAIAVDAAGNVYTTGQFQGTTNFLSTELPFELTTAGLQDVFVSKLDTNGNFGWAAQLGGLENDVGLGIAVDASGSVYTTGYFRTTADFDPGSGVFELTDGQDEVFVSKLDSGGHFVWARQLGQNNRNDRGQAIALDANGFIYTTGYFTETADFDPGPNDYPLPNGGAFVSKLDTNGNFVGAWQFRTVASTGATGTGIAVNASGNVYTTGYFFGSVDFDPGPTDVVVNSAGLRDIYVSRLFPSAAPTNVALAGTSVSENQPVGTAVGTFSTTDPDASDSHTYTLVTGTGDSGNARFTIDGATLRTAFVFDFETQNSYSIRVRSTDPSGQFVERAFTIQITINAPSSSVQPLPAQSVGTHVLVRWSGQAGAGGPDVVAYDIYVSEDGGPFTRWLASTPRREAAYVGQVGRSYGFYSQARDRAGNLEAAPAAADAQTLLIAGTLRVIDLTPTPAGFSAQFNYALEPTTLNLYDTQAAALGPPDAMLVGNLAGAIRGSLVVDAANGRATFLQTGGPLPTGNTYTIALRSGTNAFRTTSGALLDGNADGTAGDDYSTTFAGPAAGSVVVSIPDFPRGPGQPVNLPATTAGLPLRLSGSAGITSLKLTLLYDPSLLTLTAATVAAGLPPGAAVMLDTSIYGSAELRFTSPTPLPSGIDEFVRLTAAVPSTATYSAKQVLDILDLRVNDGALAALADDGLHAAVYLGDTTGNARYSSNDAQRALRVDVGFDSGFAAYPLVDPRLVGDVNGDGRLSALDATRILQEAVGIDQSAIPPLPANPPTITMIGPDPTLSLPKKLAGRPGDVVVVPVNLDLSDGLEALDLALEYDASRLELTEADVRRGSLTGDFDLFLVHLDPVPGRLQVGLARTAGPVVERGSGSVLELAFRIKAAAPTGPSIINLLDVLAPTQSRLNEGGLVLNPAPSNLTGDILDGVITVRADPLPRVTSRDGGGQRARVDRLAVDFNSVVQFLSNPARVFRLAGPHGPVQVGADVSLDEEGLRTMVRLILRGADVRLVHRSFLGDRKA